MTGRHTVAGIGDGELAHEASVANQLAAAALDLALRFRAGATLWCVAPGWPGHAHRLAGYFRAPEQPHRALAAVAAIGSDPLPSLRAQARSGDALVALARGGDPAVADLMQRAQAWGCIRVWMGAGQPPHPSRADYVIWHDGDPADVAHDGTLMTSYHLLGELTRLCLDHPEFLGHARAEPPSASEPADRRGLGEVIEVHGNQLLVRTANGVARVDGSRVLPVDPRQLVVVDGRDAISIVEPWTT